ncbi:MAG TPA: sugar nucleotide-binding protein, partial [Planctomycetaceae bacterium]|nr:sugar nucleotide-binding protein [Planctomycetaceae bacterium]
MKIAITGAGGLVGSHLARHFARSHEVLALKHGDLEITDEAAVNRVIVRAEPSLVINCAVNAVDDCEHDPERARAINAEGPRNLAQAASRVGAELI